MFVDTNVLVYATQLTSPFHLRAREALQRHVASGEPLCLSRQIIREYLAVITRPHLLEKPVSASEALKDVERFEAAFAILEDGSQVAARLLELFRTVALAGRQVHDANIVATMLAYGETRLLTANAKDFVRFVPRIELVAP